MRSLVSALTLVVLSVLLLARSSGARPAYKSQTYELKPVIGALETNPAARHLLAAARWHAEVLQQDSITAFALSSNPEAVAVAALGASVASLAARSCGAPTPGELKAAGALLTEFGEQLPVPLRAYTLGHQGQPRAAADLLATWVESHANDCDSRTARELSFAVTCIEKFTPTRDVTSLKASARRVEQCEERHPRMG